MAQIMRPNFDVDTGGWGPVNSSPLYSCINEITPNDSTDFIRGTTLAGQCRIGLTNANDPVTNTGHVVRYRGRSNGSGSPERVTVYLYESVDLIATIDSAYNISRTTWETREYTLTTAEADAIIDYSILELRFEPANLAGADNIEITWAEMEIPDAPTPGNPEVITHHYKMRRNQ